VENLWEQILLYVKERISKPSFEAWFENTKGYIKDENELIIEVNNQFNADWLESRYSTLLDEAIDSVYSDVESYVIVASNEDEVTYMPKRRFTQNEITDIFYRLDQLQKEVKETNDNYKKIIEILEEIRKEKN